MKKYKKCKNCGKIIEKTIGYGWLHIRNIGSRKRGTYGKDVYAKRCNLNAEPEG